MKDRCLNINNQYYYNYGGRGIIVCDRWLNSFENFYADMGPKPTNDHSIDRYPNGDGNYEPGNCRWATSREQNNNRRDNVIINYNGNDYTRGQLAEKFNIPTPILAARLLNNWPIEKALKTPIRNYN